MKKLILTFTILIIAFSMLAMSETAEQKPDTLDVSELEQTEPLLENQTIADIGTILKLFTNPAGLLSFSGIVLLLLVGLRLLGEILIFIGKKKEGEDWFDSWGLRIKSVAHTLGSILSFIGIGNSKSK